MEPRDRMEHQAARRSVFPRVPADSLLDLRGSHSRRTIRKMPLVRKNWTMLRMPFSRRPFLRRDSKHMKYLSNKPFTGGANSQAYVDRWEDTFGKQDPGTPCSPEPLLPPSPNRIFVPPCGEVENGSPCILPWNHLGKHYTAAERAAFQVNIAKREVERLDFLVSCKLLSSGDPQSCEGDGEVSKAKDRTPFEAVIDRQNTMAVLKRRLKRAYLDRLVLTLTEAEIFSLLLLFEGHEEPSHS